MAMYTYKDRTRLFKETSSVIGIGHFLINLYNYPTKELLTARKLILESEANVNRKKYDATRATIREKMIEAIWQPYTNSSDVAKYRVDVEKELISEESQMSKEDLEKLNRNRLQSNKVQRFSVFEKKLIEELRGLMALNIRFEPIEGEKAKISSEKEIKEIIKNRVKSYYNNTFHYDDESKKSDNSKPVKDSVITIGA